MITLYGSPRSSAGRCIWMLEETGVAYALKDIDMKNKEHKSPDFLKINPMGKVPALSDGETTLFESMAINFYLADTYKKDLLGMSSKERGLAMQWSFWASSELQAPVIEIFIQRFFMPEEKRDQAVIDENMKQLPTLLQVLDSSLAQNKYLAGNNFTIGDLNAASVVGICPMIGIDLAEYGHIKKWLEAMNERPAFRKYQELRK